MLECIHSIKAKAPTVMVIEDQTSMCDFVEKLLKDDLNYEVIGKAEKGTDGVAKTIDLKPDLLILDMHLPDISGSEVLQRLRLEMPKLRVLIFSSKIERQLARILVKDGVQGFVHKNSRISELRDALCRITQGGKWFSSEFNQTLHEILKNRESRVDQMTNVLTEREREIAVMIAKSYTSKQVASALKISTKTAENHRTNLMRKLGVHDVAGVVRFVIRQGFYDPTVEN